MALIPVCATIANKSCPCVRGTATGDVDVLFLASGTSALHLPCFVPILLPGCLVLAFSPSHFCPSCSELASPLSSTFSTFFNDDISIQKSVYNTNSLKKNNTMNICVPTTQLKRAKTITSAVKVPVLSPVPSPPEVGLSSLPQLIGLLHGCVSLNDTFSFTCLWTYKWIFHTLLCPREHHTY